MDTENLVVELIHAKAAGVIEEWRFDEDAIHILLANEVVAHACCKMLHVWFVNRDGKTRCIGCDDFMRTPAAIRVFAGQGKR